MNSWCDLPMGLLKSINLNLSGPDGVRLRSVCSSWSAIAKGQFRGPFLVLPSYSDESNERSLQLLSVQDGMRVAYTAKKNLEKLLDGGVCVGSSHEWLFVLDAHSYPWLLNLFSGKQIQLPDNDEAFPHVRVVTGGDEEEGFEGEIGRARRALVTSSGSLHDRIRIEKAILSASPSYNENYKVVIIYGQGLKLAYCSGHGDMMTSKWTFLCHDSKYVDALWEADMLYALTEGQCVVAWDFKEPEPRKRRIFSPSYLEKIEVLRYDAIQLYLAISKGDILLVHRYIGDRVNGEGEVLEEADLLPDYEDGDDEDYNNHPLVCPYRTLEFKVFRRDLKRRTWSKVESLKEEAIFLGGNQTISLSTEKYPGLKKGSIYFTDNYWDRMNEDYLYGGHDIGVFNLESRSLDMFVDSDRIEPTPFWVSIL